MTTYCTHCGTALPFGARFCSNCGAGPIAFPQVAPPRPLVRPRAGRQVAGVCAGVSQTYGWDVGTIRIVTVLAAIFLCPLAEIAYLAGWLGIPEEPVMLPDGYPPAGPGTYPPSSL